MTFPQDPISATATSRRLFLQRTGVGLGSIALSSLLARESRAVVPLAPAGPLAHFAPRAKHMIYLHMVGAPSHLDLFEHKPALNRFNGKPSPMIC